MVAERALLPTLSPTFDIMSAESRSDHGLTGSMEFNASACGGRDQSFTSKKRKSVCGKGEALTAAATSAGMRKRSPYLLVCGAGRSGILLRPTPPILRSKFNFRLRRVICAKYECSSFSMGLKDHSLQAVVGIPPHLLLTWLHRQVS